MKFTIVRSSFIDALKGIQNIISSRNPLPILQNVLLEARDGRLLLTTTDLDLSMKCTVDCEVIEDGCTTLPVKLLASIILKAPEGAVEVSVDEGHVAVIKAGSARYRLNGKSNEDFPQSATSEDAYEYTLSRSILHEMLRKVAYAASQDDTRRTLKGILMSFKDAKLTLVATDGRRLALVEHEVDFPLPNERDIVLPPKTVQELMRSLNGEGDVTIQVQPNRICFVFGSINLSSKLMDDTYPNYQQVIPRDCAKCITIDRQLLLDALDRASVMTMEGVRSVRLVFEGDKLTVSSSANEFGEATDEVPVKYAGERLEIIFNPSFVMDPLRVIDDDEVVFNLNDGTYPAVIRCSIPFLYVLMPLRMS